MTNEKISTIIPRLNIDPTRQPSLSGHRCGWSWALRALEPLHNSNGILFDSFLERTFCWYVKHESQSQRIPYRDPWIGILHNPPGVPIWHDYQNSPQQMLRSPMFQDSLKSCHGIFVLSNYLRDWLSHQITTPISVLTHPTDIQVKKFDFSNYNRTSPQQIVQVGWWLRKLSSIYRLPVDGMSKLMLNVRHDYYSQVLDRELKIFPVTTRQKETVSHIDFLSDEKYDDLLSRSIVFCDLFDSSANNTVIECITRTTPLLINPLPAVREYLGEDYPFYFETIEEAASKAQCMKLVFETHDYLKKLDNEHFQEHHFRNEVVNSTIYQSLLKKNVNQLNGSYPKNKPLHNRNYDSKYGVIESNISLMRAPTGKVHISNVILKFNNHSLSKTLSYEANQQLRGKTFSEAKQIIGNGFLISNNLASHDLRNVLVDSIKNALSSFG